jgi:hypothetical protein
MILPSGRRWLIIMAAIDGLDSVQFISVYKDWKTIESRTVLVHELMIQDHGRNRDMERT